MPGFCPYLCVLLAVGAAITETAGLVALQVGASRRYDGPMGKSDRAFVVGTLAFLVGVGVPTGRWLDVVLGLVVALLGVTVVNRSIRALREAR